MSVEYSGQIFKTINKKGRLILDLSNQGIRDISEIKGLEKISNLRILNLNKNQITEIKGLDNLRILETLSLENNNISEIKGLDNLTLLENLLLSGNNISEIKGLGNLTSLKRIELRDNPVRDWAKETFGRYWTNPQRIVKYCKQKVVEIGEPKTIKISREEIIQEEKKNKIIFVSYATKDAELFKIQEIAKGLTIYNEIEEVLYYEAESYDNFVKYMNDNLGRCDVVLLFCSPNALESGAVEKEWTAADAMNKPIIPVFIKADHIPPLLKSRLGVEFDTFNLPKSIQEIHRIIMKR
ncbi:MAG: TIR domain-containing protein [Promethearchaeota archaeon]